MGEHLIRWRRMCGAGPFLVAALLVCGLASAKAFGQELTGQWQGTLEVGRGQRILVEMTKTGTGWAGVVSNLDADMAYEGRKTTQMSLDGGVVRFAITPVDVRYEGKLSADGGSIAGAWKQGNGEARPLTLMRATTGDAASEIPKAAAMMAKDADPDWEVAAIKPSDPNDPNTGFHLKGSRIQIERKTVETMLLLGYGMHKKQIVGAPDWIATERWDIEGIADMPGKPDLKQFQSLVRKILVERFGVKEHTEKRELGVYALTVAKSGPKLTRSASDPNGLMAENDSENGGQVTMRMTNSTMRDFSLLMNGYLDRPLVDQTGLKERYDFALRWTKDDSRAPTDGSAAPGLFTAIQEQVGLKLDPVKAPVEVLVIDHVERPGAN